MELSEARKRIDDIDERLIGLFERRMELSAQIASYKRQNSLATLDEARENEKLASLDNFVSPDIKPYALKLYKKILSLSREYQNELRNSP